VGSADNTKSDLRIWSHKGGIDVGDGADGVDGVTGSAGGGGGVGGTTHVEVVASTV